MQKKGHKDTRKTQVPDKKSMLLLCSTQLDITGLCMAEARDEWLKRHTPQSTSRREKDSVQLLEPLASSPDQTRQTLSHGRLTICPHHIILFQCFSGSRNVFFSGLQTFVFFSCTTIFSSTLPQLLQLQLYVVLLVKAQGWIKIWYIDYLFKHTCSSLFSPLQWDSETCRKGWLCVRLYKISTLHMVCPVIQREM
jgi:hypothetical protein